MGAADTVQAALERFIDEVPVTLAFVRVRRVDKKGRFEKVTEEHGPYKTRLLRPEERMFLNLSAGTPGAFNSDILLAIFGPSFQGQEGTEITEVAKRVDDESQVFTVRSITPLHVFGQLVGYSCVLERGRPREI